MHAEIEAYIYNNTCMGTIAPALRVADCVPLHLYVRHAHARGRAATGLAGRSCETFVHRAAATERGAIGMI